MGAVPSQPLTGKDITGPSQNNMKAFVAVFAGVAAASAAPEADPYLLAHPVYLDPHATSGETVELPTGEVVPDTTNAVKLATADHLLAKALHTPWLWHYGKREAEAEADPWLLAHPVLLDPHASSGETVELPNGAVVPDETNSVKLAKADHLLAKALHTPLWWHYGKREAEADPLYGLYGYGLAPYAVVPKVEGHPTGLIFSPGSGAATPDFTDAQKEANPEIAEGSKSIDIPVVTGYSHVVGKREAEPYYYGGLGYGHGGYLYGKRSAEAEAKPYYALGYGGLGYGYGYYGKRSAEAEAKPYYGVYGYGVAPYAVVPEIEPKATGFIVSPASGAVTPDFTAEQKEANPEIAEGSKSIDVPVVTGFTHYLGKREAEPYYYGGLGYGYGGYLYGKRSAEAEPYYGLGYGYGGYGYGGYLYGKRSAEAEAKPYYGLYGYGLYGYGGLCAYCG